MNLERTQVGWGFWLWWVLGSIAGLSVGALVALPMYIIVATSPGTLDLGRAGVVFGIVFGASVGIGQWSVLRRQVARAGWWVLASIVSLAVGIGLGAVVGLAVDFGGAGVGFFFYLAFTGSVLVWLLLQPVTAEPSPPQEAA